MLLVVFVAAQAQPDPTTYFSSLGVAGVVCAVLTWVWLRAEKRADAAELRERATRDRLEERIIPLLTEAVGVMRDARVADTRRVEDANRELAALLSALREAK